MAQPKPIDIKSNVQTCISKRKKFRFFFSFLFFSSRFRSFFNVYSNRFLLYDIVAANYGQSAFEKGNRTNIIALV